MGKWRVRLAPKNKGKGKGLTFLRGLVGHEGNDCILWPFAKLRSGYGQLGFYGKVCRANRVMCELAYGKSPTPKHEASHSCHKPLCVNPRHLSWKTHSENVLDKRANGTNHMNNSGGTKGKLTPEQVREIRDLKGKQTQAAISVLFKMSEFTVRSIHQGKTYRNVA